MSPKLVQAVRCGGRHPILLSTSPPETHRAAGPGVQSRDCAGSLEDEARPGGGGAGEAAECRGGPDWSGGGSGQEERARFQSSVCAQTVLSVCLCRFTEANPGSEQAVFQHPGEAEQPSRGQGG